MKALRLNSNHSFAFSFANGKKIDHMKPVSNAFKNVNWHDLKGKTITNKNVILTRYGDVHGFDNSPVFTCETLFLDSCDKNFIAYWLNKGTFPNVKTVYLDSHPCDHYCLPKDIDKIYLHSAWRRYKERWWSNRDNIELIDDEAYKTQLSSYAEDSEEMFIKE